MNIHIYRQADSRWASLPYPGKGYNFGPNACGACAVLHCIIEMDKYKNWTPKDIQPYMKQFATYGSGTTWAGIQKALIHYGLKDVANIPTMPQLWRELEKGNRVGVLLFGSTHGPDGTVWTTGGHYIAFTGYRVKNGQHQLYLKDSGGRKHDGWYSYEKSMKGDVRQVWIGRLPNGHEIDGKPADVNPAPSTDGKLTVDGVGGAATIKALQKYLKMSVQDGKLGGQNKSLNKYYPSITSVSYGLGGSATVKALQKWVGVSADGIWGQGTSKALQKKLGITADGIFGAKSVKALQKFLNDNNGGGGASTTKTSSTTTAPSQTPAPSTPANFRENIIDVSYVQSKTIDWNKVKADGVHGAIIRCGYRGYGSGALNEDSMFMNHITGANKAGLKLGIYFFTEAINAAEGKAEAQFTLKMLKKAGVKLTYPIAIDTENINAKNPVPRANSTKLSAVKRTEAIKAFCEEIKANGYEPMIYASTEWLNNQLIMSKLPYKVWVAQYNTKVTYKGSYVIWQYSSVGKVNGISGVVDMNHSYINVDTTTAPAPTTVTPVPTPVPTPTPTPTPVTPAQSEVTIPPTQVAAPAQYKGTLPSLKIVKSNAQVIEDAIKWAKWIAGDNRFHYGKGKDAHHNGCYFCDTQPKSKKNSGILDYKFTYCCNPFIGAAWAHGGCIPKALDMCQHGNSWDFNKGSGYDKSSLFTNLGHPAQSTLKPGDVLCNDTHVAMYIGNGKIVEASGGDDNKRNSTKWNNSIRVTSLSALRYKGFKRVHRFNSSVNTTMVIRYGEVSDRVKDLQRYLNWYFEKEVCAVDGIFGDGTLKYVKAFQTARKLAVDGIVGANTIAEMGKVTK